MATSKQTQFQAMLAGKKGKKPKQADPTKPFPAPKSAPMGKKPMAKVDMMLMKAMPGIGPKGMPLKKGSAMPMAKKQNQGKKQGVRERNLAKLI